MTGTALIESAGCCEQRRFKQLSGCFGGRETRSHRFAREIAWNSQRRGARGIRQGGARARARSAARTASTSSSARDSSDLRRWASEGAG
eukprot:5507404-Pleurochrysis_carterae.AAC.1